MQRLIHGASASKSLLLHYEGAGVLFPVTRMTEKKNMIVSRRTRDLMYRLHWLASVKGKNPYLIFHLSRGSTFLTQNFPCVTSECICTPSLHLAWLHCHRNPSPRARVSTILSTSLPFNDLPPAQGLVAWQHVFQNALSAEGPLRVYQWEAFVWDLGSGKEVHVWAALCGCVGLGTLKVLW